MTAVAPARRVAFDVVRRVFEDGAWADRTLRAASGELDQRDRALAQRLAYGTVQRARTLDHAIETLGRRPVARIDPPVLAALRLGAYQLGYLDGVPRYAAVNESVELVRAAGAGRAVSFANAVLRRVAEGIGSLLESLPESEPAEAALRHSYPDWVADTWWRDLGPEGALESDAGAERATGDRGAAGPRRDRRAPRSGRPRGLGRRAGRRARGRGGTHLAPESRLPARRARRGLGRGRARARPLRRTRRQGDDAGG